MFFLLSSHGEHGQCAKSKAKYRVLLFDGRGVQYFPDEESANNFYSYALKEDKDPEKPQEVK